jgi:hypothetical protein
LKEALKEEKALKEAKLQTEYELALAAVNGCTDEGVRRFWEESVKEAYQQLKDFCGGRRNKCKLPHLSRLVR